ncbi:MAG: Vms1/Ankzf1 family peptidyl-tRNA hydrolase [Candidatus Thermoplasmatota archaeon]|nr:Vms1/Ankzf1 family peptidyl-tRNA hydrolase [Candidatus Thermoplasmatota archaeon]
MSRLEVRESTPVEALKNLVELNDFRPVFITIVKARGWSKYLDRRISEIERALNGKAEQTNFTKSMEHVKRYLEKGDDGPMAIFVSAEKELFTVVRIPCEEATERLVADTSPFIRDIARVADGWESYLLVVTDEGSTTISLMEVGKEKLLSENFSDIMHRHKNGGMSQRRYQRLRDGAVEQYMKEMAEEVSRIVEKNDVEKIVLAGGEGGKKELYEQLPQHIQGMVIKMMDVDPRQDDITALSLEAFFSQQRTEEEVLIARLRSAVMKGEAIYGIQEVAMAVLEGRACMVLVTVGMVQRGWRCEKCQMIGKGEAEKCPLCGHGIRTVDIVEEIIEEAIKGNAYVEFMEEKTFLSEIGGMAAFLRF